MDWCFRTVLRSLCCFDVDGVIQRELQFSTLAPATSNSAPTLLKDPAVKQVPCPAQELRGPGVGECEPQLTGNPPESTASPPPRPSLGPVEAAHSVELASCSCTAGQGPDTTPAASTDIPTLEQDAGVPGHQPTERAAAATATASAAAEPAGASDQPGEVSVGPAPEADHKCQQQARAAAPRTSPDADQQQARAAVPRPSPDADQQQARTAAPLTSPDADQQQARAAAPRTSPDADQQQALAAAPQASGQSPEPNTGPGPETQQLDERQGCASAHRALSLSQPWDLFAAAALPPGSITLGRRIGGGGFSNVYEGTLHGKEGATQQVAVKELHTEDRDAFQAEVTLLSQLKHQHLLRVVGYTVSPKLQIVTEFMSYGSLDKILERRAATKQLSPVRQVEIILAVARGVLHLHTCSPPILHLDLKSGNVLVNSDWHVVVGDFGLSKEKLKDYASNKAVGSVEWSSPERLRGEALDTSADVYSFGVLIWELLTHRKPWEDSSCYAVMNGVGRGTMQLEVPSTGDSVLRKLCSDCLNFSKEKRPSFQEIAALLEQRSQSYKQRALQRLPAAHTDGSSPAPRDCSAGSSCLSQTTASETTAARHKEAYPTAADRTAANSTASGTGPQAAQANATPLGSTPPAAATCTSSSPTSAASSSPPTPSTTTPSATPPLSPTTSRTARGPPLPRLSLARTHLSALAPTREQQLEAPPRPRYFSSGQAASAQLLKEALANSLALRTLDAGATSTPTSLPSPRCTIGSEGSSPMLSPRVHPVQT